VVDNPSIQDKTNELSYAGEPTFEILELETVIGDRLDLTPLLIAINIYEDIFSPVLTGNITINDTLGLFDRIPLCGQEKLTYKVYSANYAAGTTPPTNDPLNFLHRTFDIIKITDVVQVNDYTKQLTLHFASPELKLNESIKISKGYLDMPISNVVANIMTEDSEGESPGGLGFPVTENTDILGVNLISPFLFSSNIEARYKKEDEFDSVELFIEKTKYKEPVISFPYMKPFDIINWLATRSLRECAGRNSNIDSAETANFLFFENKRGFNFVSVDTLLEGKDISTTKFKFGSSVQNKEIGTSGRDIFTETINKLQIQSCYDILKNLRNGIYASTLYTYDLATGHTQTHNYNYLENFNLSESTERQTLTGTQASDYPFIKHDEEDLTTSFFAKRMFIVNSPKENLDNFISGESERNNSNKLSSGPEEFLQKRVSQLGRLGNFRVQMEIQGNTKHKVGDCVHIDIKNWKNSESTSEQIDILEESNKYYSGYYLITSIKHTITKFEYKMSVEAVKDAYKTKIGK